MSLLLRPYCSLVQLQQFVENDDTSLTAKMETAINRASRFIEDETGRNFWFNDHTTTAYQVKRADVATKRALLPFGIITLTEVVEIVTGVSTTLDEGTDEDYYFEVGDRSLMFTASKSYPYKDTLVIKGTFGFPLATGALASILPPPTMPGGINEACIKIAAAWSGLWQKSVASISGSNETVRVQSPPKDVLEVLKRHSIKAARRGF